MNRSAPRLGIVLLAAILAAALELPAASAQILNSERIEQTFGSYGIDVLYSDDRLRISNLYSLHGGRKATRTVAIVEYPAEVDPAFAAEHASILAGGSIGATFTNAGWQVVKTHLLVGERRISPALAAAMNVSGRAALATHGYRLDIVRGADRFEYALIAEIHHPDYLRMRDVLEIYAPGWMPDRQREGPIRDLLARSRDVVDRAASALRE